MPGGGRARRPAVVLLGGRAPGAPRPRAPSGPTSTATSGTPGRTSRRPGPRSGARRPAASPTSSPASAPAARSPASAATSRRSDPSVQIVGADPAGSVYSGGSGRPYLVEGIGEDFWPTTYDPSLVDRVVPISDEDSFLMARRVTCEEGLLIGGSGRHRRGGRARGRPRARARRPGGRADPRLGPRLPVPGVRRGLDGRLRLPAGAASTRWPTSSRPAGGDIPPLVYVQPDDTVRRAVNVMRGYGAVAAAGGQGRDAAGRGRDPGRGRRAGADGPGVPRPARARRAGREGDGAPAAHHRHRPADRAGGRAARHGAGALVVLAGGRPHVGARPQPTCSSHLSAGHEAT